MIWKSLGQAAISSFGAGAGKAAMEHVLQGGRGKAGLLDGLESACLDNKRDRERVIRSLERKMGPSSHIREVVENHESLCLDDEQDRHTLLSAIVAGGRRGRRASGRRAAEDVGLYELPPQTQKSIAGLIQYSFKDLVRDQGLPPGRFSATGLFKRGLTTKEKKIVGSVSSLGGIYTWANGTLGIPLRARDQKRLANLINYSFRNIRGFGGLTAQEKKIVGSSANFTRIQKWANSPIGSKGGSSARGRRASGRRGTLVLKKTIGPIKVYFDREWEEYILKPQGSRKVEEWYHTDDKEDAFDTAKVMAKEHGHSARGRRASGRFEVSVYKSFDRFPDGEWVVEALDSEARGNRREVRPFPTKAKAEAYAKKLRGWKAYTARGSSARGRRASGRRAARKGWYTRDRGYTTVAGYARSFPRGIHTWTVEYNGKEIADIVQRVTTDRDEGFKIVMLWGPNMKKRLVADTLAQAKKIVRKYSNVNEGRRNCVCD